LFLGSFCGFAVPLLPCAKGTAAATAHTAIATTNWKAGKHVRWEGLFIRA
jgi:hypothetical protein